MKRSLPAKTSTGNTRLLKLNKIEPHHLAALSPQQQIEFRKLLGKRLNAAKGEERDVFLQKVEAIVEPDKIWDYNHARIIDAIQQYIKQFAAMPGKTALAEFTSLSRQTIHNHIKQFASAPCRQLHLEINGIMKDQVLHKLLQLALAGDVSAAKVYLQSFNQQSQNVNSDITIHHQNNYIQINNTILSQEVIEQLKPAQLRQLERTIKKSLAEQKP
jgi:oligoribonuclease NrnB/cAMP/cGMP phosphodiesterase (DHH superfamily)